MIYRDILLLEVLLSVTIVLMDISYLLNTRRYTNILFSKKKSIFIMGISIEKTHFDELDYQRFSSKVRRNLTILKQLLEQPGFGDGEASLGAEVEFYLVNKDFRVQPVNLEIERQAGDPLLTVELNRFNLEYNLTPQAFKGSPFAATEKELVSAMQRLNQIGASLDAEVVPVGILPTLNRNDFGPHMMTDIPRYRVLNDALCKMRNGPFEIHIDGADAVHLEADDVTLEGANTSFQLHWRVPTKQFAQYYNAVQIVTPIALALSCNSPTLFGQDLWQETRIALFKQSIDSRSPNQKTWRHPPRVYFGNGWIQHAWELFAATAALYPPIIPIVSDEEPEEVFGKGTVPELAEMKLHLGTTWPWNRAIYDHHENGHLRIEVRSLPAGPTPIDMSATGLFVIGAAMALVNDIDHLTAILPFHYAEHNFYRAAKFGLHSDLIWPSKTQVELRETPLLEVAKSLLPKAKEALATTALDHNEIERLLSVIDGRIQNQINGSLWQKRVTESYLSHHCKEEALKLMLEQYIQNSRQLKPLHEWSLGK